MRQSELYCVNNYAFAKCIIVELVDMPQGADQSGRALIVSQAEFYHFSNYAIREYIIVETVEVACVPGMGQEPQ